MDKKTYLAERYMSGPKADAILARSNYKKKKQKPELDTPSVLSCALFVDHGRWESEKKDDLDDIEEAVLTTDRSFKKKVSGGGTDWVTVHDGQQRQLGQIPPSVKDERPQISESASSLRKPLVGGLVSAAQLTESLRKNEQQDADNEAARLAQETIYRDASGRKIDTEAECAEAARRKRETAERKAKQMEWGSGLVQREDKKRRQQELRQERNRALAVYANDKDLNEEQKAKDRWNDPAAAVLTVCPDSIQRVLLLNEPFFFCVEEAL